MSVQQKSGSQFSAAFKTGLGQISEPVGGPRKSRLAAFFGAPAHRVATAIAVVGALALGACATPGASSPDEAVKERANARWKLLVARDFDAAYAYNTATFKSLVSLNTYKGRTGGSVVWLGAEAVDVKCPDADKCTARVRLDFKPPLRGGGDKFSTYLEETWLRESGQWWVFEPVQGN